MYSIAKKAEKRSLGRKRYEGRGTRDEQAGGGVAIVVPDIAHCVRVANADLELKESGTRACWRKHLSPEQAGKPRKNFLGTSEEARGTRKPTSPRTRGFIGMLKHADGKPALELSSLGPISLES